MTARATRLAALATAAALVLAGCVPGAGDSSSPAESSSPGPAVTGSPSPTATLTTTTTTTTTTASGACPTWDDGSAESGLASVDFNRYAGLCVGMSFAQATAAAGYPIAGEPSCPWYADVVVDDTNLFYVAALSPVESPGTQITFFRMVWYNDPALAASYEMPTTAEGIAIGSTLAQLQAAYPTATQYLIDDYARGPRDEWVVVGPNGNNYIFDITDGRVSEVNWGQVQSTGIQGEYCAL